MIDRVKLFRTSTSSNPSLSTSTYWTGGGREASSKQGERERPLSRLKPGMLRVYGVIFHI